MKKYLVLAWNWLVWSSQDPTTVSLSVKAFLTAGVTYGTIAAGMAHISLPSDLLTQLVDAIVAIVQSALMLGSALLTVIGIIRKIKSTIDGTNKVFNPDA